MQITNKTLTGQRAQEYTYQLLAYTREHLTTVKLSAYVLEQLTQARITLKKAHEPKPCWGGLLCSPRQTSLHHILYLDTMGKAQYTIQLQHLYHTIYVREGFKSITEAMDTYAPNTSTVKGPENIPTRVDEVILDFNLPYEADLTSYFIQLRTKLKPTTKLSLAVPNAATYGHIRALMSQELFYYIYLSNTLPVRCFTSKSITSLLEGMGFEITAIKGSKLKLNWFKQQLIRWYPKLTIYFSEILVVEFQLKK